MAEAPGQLSLPLFKSDPGEQVALCRAPAPCAKKPRRAVVSSRRQPCEVSRTSEAPAEAHALLTTRETAALLRVHVRTVQRLVERGELEAVHLGTAVRFDPADITNLAARLKRRDVPTTHPGAEAVRPARAVCISFADRLRSPHDEHRAP